MIIYDIDMKTLYGNYRQFRKEFYDENHFENWYRLMNDKGHKIIGVYDVNELNGN